MLRQLVVLLVVVYLPYSLSGTQRSSGRTGGSGGLALDRKTESISNVSHQVGDLINGMVKVLRSSDFILELADFRSIRR